MNRADESRAISRPDIDWLKAAILERKMAKKLEWADIAAKANVSPDAFRKIVTTKHTEDWNPDIRRAVCKALGIKVKLVISAEGVELK